MHNGRMLAVSRLYKNLEKFAFCPAGREMYLYGDPAYPLRIHLQAPFRVGILTPEIHMFNESGNECSTSVSGMDLCRRYELFYIFEF